MNIESQLRLSSGEKLEIPERLHQIIMAEEVIDSAAFEAEDLDLDLEALLDLSQEHLKQRTPRALQIASLLQQDEQRCDESVVYICVYADMKARDLLGAGDHEKAFQILSDALELGNAAFSWIKPSVARRLADVMIIQSERVIEICGLSGSIQVLASRGSDLIRAMDVALTVWEPEFIPMIQRITRDVEFLLMNLSSELSQEKARGVHEVVMLLKKDVQRQTSHRSSRHSETLKNLVESILEMFQQEVLLIAYTAYTSDGLNSEIIQYQAKNLVEKVEKRLRLLIAKKYEQQFGASWVQHIASKFRPMYERWQRYMQKDRAAFRMYNDYSPEILDFALIEDLKDLIVSQWQLFRDVFNFGYQDRNKAVFLDKVSQIISVRNALAHHRMPPENELFRTRVLCTDILLALDKSGEANE